MLCEACKTLTRQSVTMNASQIKKAVANGFKPRYGRAEYNRNLASIVGADFGVSGAALHNEFKKNQRAEHRADVEVFIKSLHQRDDNAEYVLCEVCKAGIIKHLEKRWWQFWI